MKYWYFRLVFTMIMQCMLSTARLITHLDWIRCRCGKIFVWKVAPLRDGFRDEIVSADTFLRHIIRRGRFFCLRLRNKTFAWMWCEVIAVNVICCWMPAAGFTPRNVTCVCTLSSGEAEVADVTRSASREAERTELRATADQQAACCCRWQTDWTQRTMDRHQSTT